MPTAHNPMMPHQMRPRNHGPLPTASNIFQGVASKIGSGIIDDPLEAFNRIMREKERRKEESRKEERRTDVNSPPPRRRTRSPDLRRRSPIDRRRSPRRNSPDVRGRGRSSIDKRSRSRRRSASFHSRHSRHSRSFSRFVLFMTCQLEYAPTLYPK